MRPLFGHIVVLLALTSLGPAGGTELTGHVSVLRLGSSESELGPGARLELAPLNGGQSSETVADATGRFRFEQLVPGSYLLVGTLTSGLGAERYVTVPTTGESEVELRLATRDTARLLTVFWLALSILAAGAFCSGIALYGVRRRRESGPVSVTIALLLWCAAFVLFRLLSPEMQPMLVDVASPLSSVLAAAITACVVLAVVTVQPTPLVAVVAVAAGLLLAFAARAAELPPTAQWLGVGVGLVVWTSAAGWLLSLWLRRDSYLVLAALCIAVMDTYAVFFGTTGALVQSHGEVAQAVVQIGTLPWPIAGSDLVHGVIGCGDFLFLTWFLAAALRFDLGLTRNFWAQLAALTVGTILAHTLVLAGVVQTGLPALPFMSVFFLLANRGKLNVAPAERNQILKFTLGLVVVLGILAGIRNARRPVEQELVQVETGPRSAAAPAAVWDVDELHAWPPAATVGRQDDLDGLHTEWLTWHADGRPEGAAYTTTGVFACPAGGSGLPGLLWLVNGNWLRDGQVLAERYAKLGYACLVLDWGVADRHGIHPHESEWYDVVPEVTDSAVYRLGAVALQALEYLANRPEASDRLGLVGDEWGGVVSLAVGSLDPRVKAAVASGVGVMGDGVGWLARRLAGRSEVVRGRWLEAFAPERHAARLKVPWLLVNATNDAAWQVGDTSRLFDAAGSTTPGLLFLPNRHWPLVAAPVEVVDHWLAHYLLTGPAPLSPPKVVARAAGDVLQLTLTETSRLGTADARFHVAVAAADTPAGAPGYYWQTIPASRRAGRWRAAVKIRSPAPLVSVIGEADDAHGGRMSSPVFSCRPGDLGLTLAPAGWPSSVVAPVDAHPDAWRLRYDGGRDQLRLAVEARAVRVGCAPGGNQPSHAELVTNDTDALRRLGPGASRLVLKVGPADWAGSLSIGVFERTGQASVRTFAAKADPAGVSGTYVVPLQKLRSQVPSERVDWAVVDELVVRVRVKPGGSFELQSVRLDGTDAAAVVEVQP